MTGAHDLRILQLVGLVAGMLLWSSSSPMGVLPPSAAAEPRGTPTTERGFPYHVIATGHAPTPVGGSELVWLVQRGAASGEQRGDLGPFLLGFVLAQRGALSVYDDDGTLVTKLSPGQATFLPPGAPGSIGSASGDLVLYSQIALVPAAGVLDDLPRDMLVSEPFPAPDGDAYFELVRGILNPGRVAELPAAELPALLLAADSVLQIEMPDGANVAVLSGMIALLGNRVTIRNPGQQPATFMVARSARAEPAAAQPATRTHTNLTPQPGLDPGLDDAWHREGCHLNPGNPSCLTVGVAAQCAIDPSGPACIADGDGDRCFDVAEVQAGFDPFDAADCIGAATGQPAINCLFPMENLACNGDPIAVPEEPECAAERDIRLRRNPSNVAGCAEVADPPKRPLTKPLVRATPSSADRTGSCPGGEGFNRRRRRATVAPSGDLRGSRTGHGAVPSPS